MTTIICEQCEAVNIPNFSAGCDHYPCNQMEAILERESIVVQDCNTEGEKLEAYAAYLLGMPRSEINRILVKHEDSGRKLSRLREELNIQKNKAKRESRAKNYI